MNYSKSLKQLQMAYMAVTMKEVENSHEQCIYCWSSNCDCEATVTVENDPFLNFQDEYENVVEFSRVI